MVLSENELIMFHDTVMSRAMTHGLKHTGGGEAQGTAAHADDLGLDCAERRGSDRVPFPAEMILIWNHDAALRHRHRIIDAGDGGYRIATSLPLLEGTTGMVVRLLPCGTTQKPQPVMVAWCRKAGEGRDGYEAGLRVF